ncbi:MAG TPA: neprosin family prolyl endopeptidase [Acetobacteraceae bacterium]
MATPIPAGIQPFSQFLDTLRAAKPAQSGPAPGKVASQGAFADMHNYLVRHYDGIEAQHSFVDENGSIFDCIPIEQQPSLRGHSGKLPTAPDLPGASAGAGQADGRHARAVEALHQGRKDQHGNTMAAPDGTIPMRRLTLENLGRFETLRHFFQKSPVGSGRPPSQQRGPGSDGGEHGDAPFSAPTVAATHRWAHAYQNVPNLGGHSYLNVWNPPIGANQIFSLSQQWYVGGSGANLQTAEVGWQVYPQMYGNTKPVFFIYWTADNYNKTGCYNLSCKAFVQTNSRWAIGGTLAPVSIPGGQQYEVQVAYFLSQGRWWLYVGGEAGADAIGYYPAAQYNNGALASKAAEIDFGGETVGTTSWPPMGSGAMANAGWQHAAYQRDIRFYPPGGGTANASLTASTTAPNCYTATVAKFNPAWNETLFFGGPGGANC